MTGSWAFGASTLGSPGEDLATVLRWLTDAGASTIELRVAPGEPVDVTSSPGRRTAVRRQIAAAGIDLLSCASYVRVGADGTDDAVVADLVAHLRLAADVGARFLRLFPGAPVLPGPVDRVPVPVSGREDSDEVIARRLVAVAAVARSLGVRPVIETHDSHPRGEDVARLLRDLDRRVPEHTVGAIWDVGHPYRTGEHAERTFAELRPYLLEGAGYVQFKDVPSAADESPVLIGEGSVPLAAVLHELEYGGYAGPLSLEWERTWHPEIEPLADAMASLTRWLAQQARVDTRET